MRHNDTIIVGRFKAHGNAPYQFRAGAEASYYLQILTDRGERTLWGKDLKRAIDAAQTHPSVGDVIGARRIAREAITFKRSLRDGDGRIIGEKVERAYRNRWAVEKAQFFADRAKLARRVRDVQMDARTAVRAQPELISTYLSLRGAREIADKRIANLEDRERFVALVREAMAGSIEKGEPLPVIRVRERPKEVPVADRSKERTR
jgi:putative DNA primase/helicase